MADVFAVAALLAYLAVCVWVGVVIPLLYERRMRRKSDERWAANVAWVDASQAAYSVAALRAMERETRRMAA